MENGHEKVEEKPSKSGGEVLIPAQIHCANLDNIL